jgi:hypothetical protein
MKRKMFLDSSLQQEFDEKGYVKIPFLNPDEVTILKDFYLDHFYNRNEQYNGLENRTFTEFSVINFKPEFKKKCFDQITKICLPRANSILYNCEPLIGNFIAKYNEKGLLPIHQNWAVVDEKKFASVSIWCPLQDTDEINGTLYFVEGSHTYFRGNRHTQTHESFAQIHNYLLDQHLKPIPTKAGEAIILDDAIIHYSPVNQSSEIRLAVQIILKPTEATAQFIESDPDNPSVGKVYHVDPEFFFHFNEFKADKRYKVVKQINISKPVYSEQTFLKKNQKKKWWQPG